MCVCFFGFSLIALSSPITVQWTFRLPRKMSPYRRATSPLRHFVCLCVCRRIILHVYLIHLRVNRLSLVHWITPLRPHKINDNANARGLLPSLSSFIFLSPSFSSTPLLSVSHPITSPSATPLPLSLSLCLIPTLLYMWFENKWENHCIWTHFFFLLVSMRIAKCVRNHRSMGLYLYLSDWNYIALPSQWDLIIPSKVPWVLL